MNTIVRNAWRAAIEKETVPACERVFSLFERHTELIKRGRREKPVEFGHKVLLCQTAEKFISDYEVYERQHADCELTESVIERHECLYGVRPKVLAADKGFCPEAEEFHRLSAMVDTLAIPRRMQDFMDKVLAHWQAFRAGIEGTISGLKRAFRLVRCFFKGFRSFSAAVGLGVFCHNLIVVAEQGSGWRGEEKKMKRCHSTPRNTLPLMSPRWPHPSSQFSSANQCVITKSDRPSIFCHHPATTAQNDLQQQKLIIRYAGLVP